MALAVVWRPWDNRRSEPTAASPSPPPSATAALTTTARPAPPPPSPPGVFPASAIDTLPLTPTEINTLVAVGTVDPLLQVRQTTYEMLNNSNLVTPQECAAQWCSIRARQQNDRRPLRGRVKYLTHE